LYQCDECIIYEVGYEADHEVSAQNYNPAVPMPSKVLADDTLITRIALGSCFDPNDNASVFTEISNQSPDVFLFLGDNVYAEDESFDPKLKSLREAYAKLATVPEFSQLRSTTPVLAIWDDHDMGLDDAGADWPLKNASERLYEYVWAVPGNDPRTAIEGVYYERTVGPTGRRVQMIFLDVRSFRSTMTPHPDPNPGRRYIPRQIPDQQVLGETQWQWLGDQLRKPADLRIIATPIQFAASGHHMESWHLLPSEQLRFSKTISASGAENVILVSGDKHAAAVYKLSQGPYPLYEFTSSSLNIPLTKWVAHPVDAPNPARVTPYYYETNYGLIDIDWQAQSITMKILDARSALVSEVSIEMDTLKRGNPP
jgi:alkaline phosphatase D